MIEATMLEGRSGEGRGDDHWCAGAGGGACGRWVSARRRPVWSVASVCVLAGSAQVFGIGQCPVGVPDRAYCRNAFFLGLDSCFLSFPDDDDELGRCIETERRAYIECLGRVCEEDWQDDGGADPDVSDCLSRRDAQIEDCKDAYAGRVSTREVFCRECIFLANTEYQACRRRDNSDAACATIESATVTGSLAAGEVRFDGGVSQVGTVVMDPSANPCAPAADRVVTRAYVLSESGPQPGVWIELDDAALDASGRLVATFDPVELAHATRYAHAAVTVDWYAGGAPVDGAAFSVELAESGVAGDYNRDGTVDSADLVAYLDSYGVGTGRADLDADGEVDLADLTQQIAEMNSGG
jgi:hypothetical protein